MVAVVAHFAPAAEVQHSSVLKHNVTYTVQPDDTLWSIAQHYYGSGFNWEDIYHANPGTIGNPNNIYAGQVLTIPNGGSPPATSSSSTTASSPAASSTSTTATTSARPATQATTASRSLPGVPSTAATYIRQAANGTGLPVSVVAAQNNVESGFGTNMGPSSAGAMGPWQFMPGTWSSYSNAPFSVATSWSASTPAYIAMMNQLLHWSGGNVQMALAAYNAGQGNWQAGLGYANTILARAAS